MTPTQEMIDLVVREMNRSDLVHYDSYSARQRADATRYLTVALSAAPTQLGSLAKPGVYDKNDFTGAVATPEPDTAAFDGSPQILSSDTRTHFPGKPICHLVWRQGCLAIDDVADYYEVARKGDKSVDGSDPFPVYRVAPPPPAAVQEPGAVKALEWTEWKSGQRGWQANTVLGQYQVCYLGEHEEWQLFCPGKSSVWSECFSRHSSSVAAKEAAKEDYVQRIRSAISTSQSDPVPEIARLELLNPADDEAIEWVTTNLMAVRRDDGAMHYDLTQVVRAFQAAKATERDLCNDIVRKAWGDKISVDAMAEIAALRAENERLRMALEWYGENARLCRLIHSEGDKGRYALAADGGNRARAAIAPEQDEAK